MSVECRMTELDGVVEIVPKRFGDSRGWFSETWNSKTLAEADIDITWVQDNESLSAAVGTLRGIHYQSEPKAQDKLVRVVRGAILDVAVDLRRSSPTFGNWVARELTSEQGNQLLVPRGFGHAFCTLVPDVLVAYKVSDYYSGEHDHSIQWDDPQIGVEWPAVLSPDTLSAKDTNASPLSEALPTLFE